MLRVSRDQLASGAGRAWSGFTRWRRGRPFWGGLLLLLSGLEMYGSAHQDLTPLKVSFGPQVFLSWVIPGALVLCGLLTWFTPAQRAFYGILGALIAVSALVGLNLGGFFVGLLLGLIGGAFAVAWSPAARPAPAVSPVPAVSTVPSVSTVPAASTVPAVADSDDDPDTVVLDDATARPDPPTSRLLAVLLMVAVLTAGLVTVARPTPAAAAPCPTSPVSSRPVPPATGATPTPSASSSTSGSTGGNPVVQLFDSLGRLLGIGPGGASPSPSPSSAPAPAPAAKQAAPANAAAAPAAAPNCGTSPTPKTSTSGSARPAPGASAGASPSTLPPGTAKAAAVPAGQPRVNRQPSTQISAKLVQTMLVYDGVVELSVAGGTLRALKFHLDTATSIPFELDVPTGTGTKLIYKSSKLSVSGHVTLYATRITGTIGLVPGIDLLPADFTPDSPPPPIPFAYIEFANATVQLVYLHAGLLTAANLQISG